MKSKAKFLANLFSILLLITVVIAYFQRQAIYDWVRLRNYIPPTNIAALADYTTMYSEGKRLFYINRPELQDKSDFAKSCTIAEKSIILGCYITNRGIYIYDVKDPRLNGVEEVTAAHEMLHSAYDRLSEQEKSRIDDLTKKEFAKIKDQRIIKTVETYKNRDPSVVPNELHSIIATEVRNISPELEDYYSRYFKRRLTVVEFSEKYENSFTELENQAQGYKNKLDNLKKEIDNQNNELTTTANNLTNEYKELQSIRGNTDAETFNEDARIYNQKVNEYNVKVLVVSKNIDEYNAILEKYNGTVNQENELYNAIDSRPKTINSQ